MRRGHVTRGERALSPFEKSAPARRWKSSASAWIASAIASNFSRAVLSTSSASTTCHVDATTTTQRAVLSAPSASATCRATCLRGAIVIGQIVICHVIALAIVICHLDCDYDSIVIMIRLQLCHQSHLEHLRL